MSAPSCTCPVCTAPSRRLVVCPGFAVKVCEDCATAFTTPVELPRDDEPICRCGSPIATGDGVIVPTWDDPIGVYLHRACRHLAHRP